MSMTKIKAYTISEMLVVMLLSAIVISVAYTVLNIFNLQYLNYKNTRDDIYNLDLLDRLMVVDFSNADNIIKDENRYIFNFPARQVTYAFSDSLISRTENQVEDRFEFQTKGVSALFFKIEVQPLALVDELRFEIVIKDQNFNFHYQKLYAADVLLNFESKNGL
jgi:hypothetical protein